MVLTARFMSQVNAAMLLLLLLLNILESPWNVMCATFNLNMYMPPFSDKYFNISNIQYSHHLIEITAAHLYSCKIDTFLKHNAMLFH